jgi:hypothetical protein
MEEIEGSITITFDSHNGSYMIFFWGKVHLILSRYQPMTIYPLNYQNNDRPIGVKFKTA